MRIGKLYRLAKANDLTIDEENNVVDFSFSSEEPVERWFGEEVLSHQPGAMNLVRVDAGAAPFLWNHDANQPLGMVQSAAVKGKVGQASAKYFTTPFAQEKKQQYKEGLRNISFMYQIDAMEETRAATKEKPAQYTATKYTVFEISQVSIPADFKVGGGRAEGEDPIEVEIINKRNESKGVRKMENETKPEIKPIVNVDAVKADAVAAERVRSAAISEIGKKFKQEELARQFIDNGKTVDEARAAVLEKLGQKQIPLSGNEGVVGLSEKEKRNYSFMRAIRAQMFPNEKKFQEEASFEREVSIAAQDKGGKAARGFMVPVDVLRGKRDLTVGSATAGGNLVQTDLLSGSFIELLRNRSVVQAAGATVLNGLVGNVAIPKASGAATAYWVAESGAPTESAQAVAQVSMSPKTVGAFNDFSRKLMLQSSIDVENFVRQDLAAVIALAIDLAALYGTGSSNQPTGLKAALAGGAQESNFAAATPTFAEVIGLETKVTAANGDIGSMKYIVNASMRGSLKGAVKVSGFPSYIMESDGSMNGYPSLVSNQVASGDVLFGVWSQLIMGFWSGLDLLVDPYSQSTSGTIRVVALQDCDIAIRHSESFARGNDNP